MTVTQVRVRKLHGHIDQNLILQPGVNLLVGINGSGKTSVLLAITLLLSPSMPDLCALEFRLIAISFRFEGKLYELVARKGKRKLTVKLLCDGEVQYQPLVVELQHGEMMVRRKSVAIHALKQQYAGLQPEAQEIEMYDFLRRLPEPYLITVERRLHVNHSSGIAVVADGEPRKRTITPLDDAKRHAAAAYGKFRTSLIEHSAELQNDIILSAFEQGLEEFSDAKRSRALKDMTIQDTKRIVTGLFSDGYISQRTDPEFRVKILGAIEKFFNVFGEGGPIPNPVIFERIRNLVQVFLTFENKAEKAFRPVQLYLEAINKFFSDSNKVIFFDGRTNELMFRFKNEDEESGRDISLLASGEQQLIILFSYIAFLKDRIILIDEPEVSLHIRWQEMFLENVKGFAQRSQIVFATHSPGIVGRNIDMIIALQ